MLHPGVDHQQGQAGGGRVERDRLRLHRAGVEEEGVTGPAAQHGHLVHQPAGHPHDLGLRPLAGEGERDPVPIPAAEVGQSQADGGFQRRARRQTGPGRQVGVHHQVRPGHRSALVPQDPGDPLDVGRPARRHPRAEFRQRPDRRAGPVADRPAAQDGVVAPGGGHHDGPVDGHRQDEAAVVVRVLPDEVDPPRRPPDAVGPAPRALDEGGGDGVDEAHQLTSLPG